VNHIPSLESIPKSFPPESKLATILPHALILKGAPEWTCLGIGASRFTDLPIVGGIFCEISQNDNVFGRKSAVF
jgi:hypothetical protein